MKAQAARSAVNAAWNDPAVAKCATSSSASCSAAAAVRGGARPSIRCCCGSGDGDGAFGRRSSGASRGHIHAPCQSGRPRHRWSVRGNSGVGGSEGFSSSASMFLGSEPLRLSICVRAKRKTGGGEGATRVLEDADEQLDEDMRLGLNEISTEALRAMLSEDDRTVEELREKVEDVEYYLTRLEQLDAAKFMVVVKGLLDHEVVPATYQLKGPYRAALDRITSVIEDSGWVLKREGTDLGGVGMVDDELMPPVLNSQY